MNTTGLVLVSNVLVSGKVIGADLATEEEDAKDEWVVGVSFTVSCSGSIGRGFGGIRTIRVFVRWKQKKTALLSFCMVSFTFFHNSATLPWDGWSFHIFPP